MRISYCVLLLTVDIERIRGFVRACGVVNEVVTIE